MLVIAEKLRRFQVLLLAMTIRNLLIAEQKNYIFTIPMLFILTFYAIFRRITETHTILVPKNTNGEIFIWMVILWLETKSFCFMQMEAPHVYV